MPRLFAPVLLLLASLIPPATAAPIEHLGTDDEGIRLRVAFEEDDPSAIQFALAVPPTGALQVTTEAMTLTRQDPETGELMEQVHASRDAMPAALERVSAGHVRRLGFVRDSAIARLTAQSRTVNLASREPWRVTGADLLVTWRDSEPFEPGEVDPLMEPLLAELVSNPGDLARWATASPPSPEDLLLTEWHPVPEPNRWVKLAIEESGPVRVTRDLLADLLPGEEIDLRSVEAWHRGERLPVWIDADGEALLIPVADAFERTAPQTIVWLDLQGTGAPLPVESAVAVPPTQEVTWADPLLVDTLERDGEERMASVVEARPGAFPPREEPWPEAVWTMGEIEVNEPVVFDLPLFRGQPGRHTADGEVDVHLIVEAGRQGLINSLDIIPARRESVRAPLEGHRHFHNHAFTTVSEEALRAPSLEIVPRSQLGEGAALGGDPHRVYLESVEIRRPVAVTQIGRSAGDPVRLVAPRSSAEGDTWVEFVTAQESLVFDLSSQPPRLLEGVPVERGLQRLFLPAGDWNLRVGRARAFAEPATAERWEPTDPHRGVPQTDVLIITHADLQPAAERLAAHHRAQGRTARVVDVQEIHDRHGAGIPGPEAVRAFLREVLLTWPSPAPTSVVLLGDASRDQRGVWRTGVPNHIPTFSDPSHAAREVFWLASDLPFALVAGDDLLPDFFLGRVSVVDAETAETVVDKIIEHSDAPAGPWQVTAGFIADNDRISDKTFRELCEEVRRESMPPLPAETVYLEEIPWEQNPFIPPEHLTPENEKVSRDATTAIRDLFSEGQSLVVYYGHGGPNIWADERMWFGGDSPRSDIRNIADSERRSFLINLTCSTGAIDSPDEVYHICIAEDFLRAPGGPIALFVPTGEGTPSAHHRLTHEVMHSIFERGLRQVGPITTDAIWRMVLEGRGDHLLRHFVLLGDPATRVALPALFAESLAPEPVLPAGPAHRITLDTAPLRLEDGEGVAMLIDPDGQVIERRPLPAEQPVLEFEIPEGAKEGRWGALAARWEERTGAGEALHSDLWIEAPVLQAETWQVQRTDTSAERAVVLTVDDQGRAPLPETPVRFIDLARPDAPPLLEEQLELTPGGQRTLRHTLTGEPRLARVALEAPRLLTLWNQESGARIDDSLDVAVWNPDAPARVTTTAVHVVPREPTDVPQRVRSFSVTVGNIGGGDAERTRVTLMRRGTTQALAPTETIGTLAPGSVEEIALTLFPNIQMDAQTLEGFDVRIEWQSPDREPGLETVTVAPRVARPDVAVVPGSVTVTPEAPTQGDTIFLEARVANRGERVARQVDVELRDTSGQRLPNRAGERVVTIPALAPGDERVVRLRWDPEENAGEQTIVVVADGSRRIEESDEGNNEASASVRVLTPEDVRFTRAVRHEDPSLDPPSVLLTTQLSNFGETDARDYVVTWYREEARETKIGETPIEVIEGGATIPVEFRWEFSPEEVARMRAGENFDPTCDVGIRSGMRRFAAPLEGETATP